MDNLHCIVYTSSATDLLSQEEIDHLLSRARQRNSQHDVSGLLLYSEGSFMQYIEGPHDKLMEIYQIIIQDPKHHTIIELLNEPIETRTFESWAMAYSQAQMAELKPLLDTEWIHHKDNADNAGASLGVHLLAGFWRNQNRFMS